MSFVNVNDFISIIDASILDEQYYQLKCIVEDDSLNIDEKNKRFDIDQAFIRKQIESFKERKSYDTDEYEYEDEYEDEDDYDTDTEDFI